MQTITTDENSSSIITEAAIQNFAQILRENEHAEATIEKYTMNIRKLMLYLDGRPISKMALLKFRDNLKDTHAAQTVNGAVSAINTYLEINGMSDWKLKLLKVQRSVFRPQGREMTRQEYDRLIRAAKEQRRWQLALIMETICSTGMRVSELKYVTVEAVRQRRAEITLKGKVRTILLPGKLCKKLLKYAKKRKIVSGGIFLTSKGVPVSRKLIWAQMKSLCETAGVEPTKVFPHNLRHLFARCFYRISKDIVKLADVLGHSSIETTRIYLKSCGEEHVQTLARMDLVT